VGKKDWRRSERVKTGHTILLPTKFRDNPICPHHGKKVIIREPYDELGVTRWFCIDCIAHAIYDTHVEAVKFQIRPCGYKDQYNCVFITCEDGRVVVIPEEMVNRILEAWKEI
jgi:hypothetical protein